MSWGLGPTPAGEQRNWGLGLGRSRQGKALLCEHTRIWSLHGAGTGVGHRALVFTGFPTRKPILQNDVYGTWEHWFYCFDQRNWREPNGLEAEFWVRAGEPGLGTASATTAASSRGPLPAPVPRVLGPFKPPLVLRGSSAQSLQEAGLAHQRPLCSKLVHRAGALRPAPGRPPEPPAPTCLLAGYNKQQTQEAAQFR